MFYEGSGIVPVPLDSPLARLVADLAQTRALHHRVPIGAEGLVGVLKTATAVPGISPGHLIVTPVTRHVCFGETLAEALRWTAFQLCYHIDDDGLADASAAGLAELERLGVTRVAREEFAVDPLKDWCLLGTPARH